MTHSATLTSKGQLTLPAKLRAQMGVGPGDRLVFETAADGTVTVRAAKRLEGFLSLRGIFKTDPPTTADQIAAWIREARDAGWREPEGLDAEE